MAKRKSHKRRHRAAVSHKKSYKRRRRMGAGRGVAGALSNPVLGGIIGGLAGLAVTKFAKKANLPGGDMTGAAVPLVVGFLIRKKYPALAAGMAAGAGTALIAPRIPFLNEDNFMSAEFANPEVLSADGEPLQLNDGELQEVLSEVLSDYGQIHNATI
jgi:hypothetical protein